MVCLIGGHMSGIPLYPFRVIITFQPNTGRQPVARQCADMPGAMAVYEENKGRQNVYSVEVLLTVHKHTTGGKGQ